MKPLIYIVLHTLVLAALPIHAATVDVRVVSRGGAPVDEAVVYAIPSRPMPLARRIATMDQINRTFVPHVLPVQAGTWVEFPNSDQVRHQVFSVSPARPFTTPLYIGKPARPIQFPTAGVVGIGCSIHEQMSAYVVVVDTPYFATTTKGRAALNELAEGEYAVKVWYAGMRGEPKAQTVTVGASDKVSVSFVAE
jgi:plastocyanin